MHFMLDTVNVSLTIARRDDPYLVSTISKVNGESLGDRWNTANHRRILISNDHNTQCINPRHSSVVVALVSSSAAGASAGAAASAASATSSAFSARVAATFAMLSLGSVISVKFAGSWTSSACSMASISVNGETSTSM